MTAPEMIVLVHAGVADASMWDGFPLAGATAHELKGFGSTPLPDGGSSSHADDLEALLGGRPGALVGASFGGQVCAEVAARSPDLVTELVLMDASLPDHDWSPEVIAYAEEEDRLLEKGDVDGAVDLNARFWAPPGPVRESVRRMQARAFELQHEGADDQAEVESIDLEAITARTLVAVGERDYDDFHRIARRLCAAIPGAEQAVIPGAGHLPALEQPAATARLIADFLC